MSLLGVQNFLMISICYKLYFHLKLSFSFNTKIKRTCVSFVFNALDKLKESHTEGDQREFGSGNKNSSGSARLQKEILLQTNNY